MQCPECDHHFSFPECLAVWFPSVVPCPACRAHLTLGPQGWLLFVGIHIVGMLILLVSVLCWLAGLWSLFATTLVMVLVAGGSPFVWFGTLHLLVARRRSVGRRSSF